MTSVKIRFRQSSVKNHPGSICYQIIHKRCSALITTDMHVAPDQWNPDLNLPFEQNVLNRIYDDLRRIANIETELACKRTEYTATDIVRVFRKTTTEIKLLKYITEKSLELSDCGREGTASTYRSTCRSLNNFLHHQDVTLSSVNRMFISDYNRYLIKRNLSRNSISFYMRVLRSVLNQAEREGLINVGKQWFSDVFTGIATTDKRALGIKFIKRLAHIDLSSQPQLQLSRDIFLFSFYTRGMAFVDVAYLNHMNITNNILTYHRRKTSKMLKIKLEHEIMVILKRYYNGKNKYLFPILKTGTRKEYIAALGRYNRHLKQLGQMISPNMNLTSYMSRHSWATAAHNNNIPISVISAGMGHSSERTTKMYLDSIANSEIDKANRKIIALI